jgi:hypothetical protein
MAGLDPATHAVPHHLPLCSGMVPSGCRQRMTNRVGGRIKSGHDMESGVRASDRPMIP